LLPPTSECNSRDSLIVDDDDDCLVPIPIYRSIHLLIILKTGNSKPALSQFFASKTHQVIVFTRFFLALALLGCLAAAAAPEPSFNNLRKKKNAMKGQENVAALYAAIDIKGLIKDPSPDEIAMINDAIKIALNDGRKESDYTMTDVVNGKIWVEPDAFALFDSPQAGDDSSLTGGLCDSRYRNVFIYALFNYSCHLCRNYNYNDASTVLRQMELTGCWFSPQSIFC
jgi:hypothetical protein